WDADGAPVTDLEVHCRRRGDPRWIGSYSFTPIRERFSRVVVMVGAIPASAQRIDPEGRLRAANTELEHRLTERTLQLEQRTAALSRLAFELAHAEQQERCRVADLLHDELQQLLAAA